MSHGYLNAIVAAGKPEAYMGELNVAGVFVGDVFLVKSAKKISEKSPDFEVKIRRGDGPWMAVGGAWRNEMDKGGYCFGIAIDAPFMSGPLNVTAFPDDEQPKDAEPDKPSAFTIKWRRARPRNMAMAGAGAVQIDDEIPY